MSRYEHFEDSEIRLTCVASPFRVEWHLRGVFGWEIKNKSHCHGAHSDPTKVQEWQPYANEMSWKTHCADMKVERFELEKIYIAVGQTFPEGVSVEILLCLVDHKVLKCVLKKRLKKHRF
eukprot:UN25094